MNNIKEVFTKINGKFITDIENIESKLKKIKALLQNLIIGRQNVISKRRILITVFQIIKHF